MKMVLQTVDSHPIFQSKSVATSKAKEAHECPPPLKQQEKEMDEMIEADEL